MKYADLFLEFEKLYTKEDIIIHKNNLKTIKYQFKRADIEHFLNLYHPEIVDKTYIGTTSKKHEGRANASQYLLTIARKNGYKRKIEGYIVIYEKSIII